MSLQIPTNPTDWEELVAEAKLKRKSLHNLSNFKSGSKIQRDQFLLLRVLWPTRLEPSRLIRHRGKYGLSTTWEKAASMVKASPEVQKYLDFVGKEAAASGMKESDPLWAGSFMPILRHQQKCILGNGSTKAIQPPETRSAKRRRSQILPTFDTQRDQDEDKEKEAQPKHEAEDEAVVNTAIVLFLDAIASLAGSPAAEWTLARTSFRASFGKGGFTALTDGGLRNATENCLKGLIEVKKAKREDNPGTEAKICMQESCELVGWLLNSPEMGGFLRDRRLLVSQNANEIYVAFCSVDDGYREYLESGKADTNPFMRVQSFGPWHVNKEAHMRSLATVILAVTLLAGGDNHAEEGSRSA